MGWDGQLLFWQDIFAAGMPSDRQGLPYIEGEPQAGFKLGPSATVDFLPLAVYTLLDCGVLVTLRDKAGGVTVVSYTTPILQRHALLDYYMEENLKYIILITSYPGCVGGHSLLLCSLGMSLTSYWS